MEQDGIVYDAILVRGTPRFRANKKMVAAASIPEDVRAILAEKLFAQAEPLPPVPTVVPVVTPEELEVAAKAFNIAPEQPPVSNEFVAPGAEQFPDTSINPGLPSEYEMELIAQLEEAKQELATMHTATEPAALTLTGLAQEMYSRFGVYTVFVGEPPLPDDVNALTARPMTRYEVGLAYQNFKYATQNGLLASDFNKVREQIEDSRVAHAQNPEEFAKREADEEYGAPKYKSFNERTSVHGQNQQATSTKTYANDPISEEPTAEPVLHGQIIRRDW